MTLVLIEVDVVGEDDPIAARDLVAAAYGNALVRDAIAGLTEGKVRRIWVYPRQEDDSVRTTAYRRSRMTPRRKGPA